MKNLISSIGAAAAALGLAACAAAPAMAPGQFVTLHCQDNKSFQARMSDDARSVRVRAHHGSAELERQADGRYAGEGYTLHMAGEGGIALEHGGKSQGKACKPRA
ncbi:MAG: hypothetical protein JNJ89_03785 [Rubrivivax sp.]|nr:hypothetical protein [Rubrivivax sp.]